MGSRPVSVVAATTPQGREILQREAPSFLRCFQRFVVPPLDEARLDVWFQRYQSHLSRRGPARCGANGSHISARSATLLSEGVDLSAGRVAIRDASLPRAERLVGGEPPAGWRRFRMG
jgi:hypothetical protein